MDDLNREWPYQRGYAAIGLWRPKDKANIGGVIRAAWCHGASMVAVGMPRGNANEGIRHSRDRVSVPTRTCMNLAATVNVVLYDRIAKAMRSARKAD